MKVTSSRQRFYRFASTWVGAILLVCGMASGLRAQVSTADVLGRVTDSSGAAMAGSKVTVTNLATNETRVSTTDANGDYLVSLLPIGHYSVKIEHDGFKTWTVADTALAIGDRLRLDAALQVGALQQTIEVTAQSPALQTDSATAGTLVNDQAVQDLPLNGRNFVTLVQLSAGAADTNVGFADGNATDDKRETSQVQVNGQFSFDNNFLLDGMDDNERFIGTVTVRPSIESIQEMKVETNLYSAEVGRTAGGVINMITKSGTNEFHGSVYEFLRNQMFDAKPAFNPTGDTNPEYNQSQYGGSIGGPIQKDKTFFFMDYEGLRLKQGTNPQFFIVPTALQRQGIFGSQYTFDPVTGLEFPNNTIPQSRLQQDPVGLNVLSQYPLPTPNYSGPPGFNYESNPVSHNNEDTADARVDHRFSDSDSLFVRYTIADIRAEAPSAVALTQVPQGSGTAERTQAAMADYVHTFNPKLLMELQAGYSRYKLATTPFDFGTNAGSKVGMPNVNFPGLPVSSELPDFEMSTTASVGDTFYSPEYNTNNTYQIDGNILKQLGSQSVKTGFEYRRREVDQSQSPFATTLMVFTPGLGGSDIAALLLGYPSIVNRQLQLIAPQYRFSEFGAFVQDDWRVKPWLTLNLGVRYDYYSAMTEKHNNISNFIPSLQALETAGTNGVGPTDGVTNGKLNFAPRLGFAATIMKGTVLRGGYGLSYVPFFMGSWFALRNAPFISQFSIPNTFFGPPVLSLNGSGGLPGLPSDVPDNPANPFNAITALAPHLKIPYVEQYNLTLQRELGGGWVASIGYVGVVGRQQPFPNGGLDINEDAPGNAGTVAQRHPYFSKYPNLVNLYEYGNWSNTSYQSLQTTIERRFKNGLAANANYTYGHAIDNFEYQPLTAYVPGTPLTNFRLDSGNSQIDLRQRFAATVTYQLPFAKSATGFVGALAKGWQTNAIIQLQSGAPFGVTNNANAGDVSGTNNEGGNRPNVVGNPYKAGPVAANPSCTAPTVLGSPDAGLGGAIFGFNPCAFEAQTPGTYGNEGRNSIYGPAPKDVNFSMNKDFRATERLTVQFRAEFFNLFNHPNFGYTSGLGGVASTATLGTPGFGELTSSAYGALGLARNIQFALKLLF
jgi:outer membrane receptor protein involved in Fe transport